MVAFTFAKAEIPRTRSRLLPWKVTSEFEDPTGTAGKRTDVMTTPAPRGGTVTEIVCGRPDTEASKTVEPANPWKVNR
jgi:hypothetical protein